VADLFALQGGYTASPASGCPSGLPTIDTPLAESVMLSAKQIVEPTLTVDSPVAVAFGGVTNANVVVIKVKNGGKVKARFTSADGSTQAVPVDSLLVLTALSVPITAIDLTRVPATATIVEVFLGQKA
jgi:hypothetical protein